MSNLNQIVDVDISIAAPVVDGTSFDYVLLVGPKPKDIVVEAYYQKVYSTADGKLEIVETQDDVDDESTKIAKEKVLEVSPELEINVGDFVVFHERSVIKPIGQPAPVAVYTDLQEVESAGFRTLGQHTDPIGVAARVAFSQSPRPDKIYIAVQQEVDGKLEEVNETLSRALGVNGWYVICPAGVKSEEYENIAKWTETQEKMMIFASLLYDPGFEVDDYYRTSWIFCKESIAQNDEDVPEVNRYMNVAWACAALNYSAGSETWAFKSLKGIATSNLNSDDERLIEQAGGNYYTKVANKNITRQGKTYSGEWIDTIRFRDWLKNDMQIRIYNLFVTNPKIPYTDNGISLVQNQMIASLKAGQRAGGVAETQYNDDGEEIKGFTVTVPRASSLTESQRASRKLTGCKFTARLAGAIHMVEIKGTLVY